MEESLSAQANCSEDASLVRPEPLTAGYRMVLRDPRVTTSALIGASSPEQIEENLGALANLGFTKEEPTEIDKYAVEGGINLSEKPSQDEAV